MKESPNDGFPSLTHRIFPRPYPVSNFALQILRSMAREQVFLVQDLNPGLLRC